MKQKSIDVFYAEDHCPYCGKRAIYIESPDSEFIQALDFGTIYLKKPAVLLSGCKHFDHFNSKKFIFLNPSHVACK